MEEQEKDQQPNPVNIILGVTVILLSIALIIGLLSITHSSPYLTRDEATITFNELRNRLNVDEAQQQTFDANMTNTVGANSDRIDSMEDDIHTLMKLQKVPMRSRKTRSAVQVK